MKIIITIEGGKVEVVVDDQNQQTITSVKPDLKIEKTTSVKLPNSTVLVEDKQPVASFNRTDVKKQECQECGTPFETVARNRKFCDNCRAERGKTYQDRWKAKQLAKTGREPEFEIYDSNGTFLNPWQCGKCVSAGKLCDLHQDMTDEGRKPPLYRHTD